MSAPCKERSVPLPRLRWLAGQIHPLGPRPLFELFRELDAGADLQSALERYARLAPLTNFIAELSGDQLPVRARMVVNNE
jgi:hypothetical protein